MSSFLADNSVPVIATPDGLHMFQIMEIAGGGDILLAPTSCQWFKNLPYQLCLCWWPVLQKPWKLREAPSSQTMDRCALKALRTRTAPAIGFDDLKCLFKPKWFHDNSSSIFLSSGMSSKCSICSLCDESSGWVQHHIYTIYIDICLDVLEDARPCITTAPNDFSEQPEIQPGNSQDFAT